MSNRKFQDENDVFDDNAPVPSSPNYGKHSRRTSDVVDNIQGSEIIVQPDPSIPVRARSVHPNLVSLEDGGSKGTPDRQANVIPELLLRRSGQVDVNFLKRPEWITPQSNTAENSKRTPHGTKVRMPVAKDAECYNMGHQKRGTCLVFNQQIFEKKSFNREGSNLDVDRIEATFSRLDFDVVVHNNLGLWDVLNEIKTLNKKDHTNDDCVCVFVLTHGLDNDFLLTHDFPYTSDKIWQPFTADKCPTLAGKPKLFFFQACRGNKLDAGVQEETPLTDHADDHNDQSEFVPTSESYTIPTCSDFLIAHSCVEGYNSWRRPETGTWFVQTLCDVLDDFAESTNPRTDLLKMLTTTARRVAINFESHNKDPKLHAKKQIPSITSTLIRELYFTSE